MPRKPFIWRKVPAMCPDTRARVGKAANPANRRGWRPQVFARSGRAFPCDAYRRSLWIPRSRLAVHTRPQAAVLAIKDPIQQIIYLSTAEMGRERKKQQFQ